MTEDTKILFLDLDGTLLNDEKKITPGNLKAIHEALARGHKVVIASGRAISSLLPMAEQMSLTSEGCYAIAYNGASIYDLYHKKPVFRSPLPFDTVRFLLDQAADFGVYAHTYTQRGILAERTASELLEYANLTHMTYEVVDDVCKVMTEEPEKVIVIHYSDHQKLCDFRDKMMGLIDDKAVCFFSCPEYLEFVRPDVSKGNAIRNLCEYLGIPIENTISAGDAENDISMLQATHISVIMKNADVSMHPFGNYITEHDNNHDGIAEIIYKFILNNGGNSLC